MLLELHSPDLPLNVHYLLFSARPWSSKTTSTYLVCRNPVGHSISFNSCSRALIGNNWSFPWKWKLEEKCCLHRKTFEAHFSSFSASLLSPWSNKTSFRTKFLIRCLLRHKFCCFWQIVKDRFTSASKLMITWNPSWWQFVLFAVTVGKREWMACSHLSQWRSFKRSHLTTDNLFTFRCLFTAGLPFFFSSYAADRSILNKCCHLASWQS